MYYHTSQVGECKNFLYDSGDKRDLINKIKGYNYLVWVASLDESGGNLNV